MPIYAYRCTSCGHAKDVLQKISDPLLTGCPACGAPTFVKQVTAAGFQLKGSGWYVTDFRGGSAAGKSEGEAEPGAAKDKTGEKPAEKPADVAGGAPPPKAGDSGDASKNASSSLPSATPASAAPATPAAAPPPSGS